jgi:signal transduction histidine kinase
MLLRWRHSAPWILGWAALALAGGAALVRWDIAQRRDAFATDARIVHRLLSQRAVEIDATLATLSLLDTTTGAADAAQRLPALHPTVLRVLRRAGDAAWSEASLDAALRDAEPASRRDRRAVLATIDAARGHYVLVLAGAAGLSHALVVDAARLVDADTWPLARDGPVRVELRHGGAVLVLQPGADRAERPVGLTRGFVAAKTLDAPSQPFEVNLQRATGPAQWPWATLVAWALISATLVGAAAAVQRQRTARRRAEDLLRLGQVARLNTLGEMAAGLAHELNQPLAAVLANAQAARRWLAGASVASPRDTADPSDDDDLVQAREAIVQVVAQARRASDVVQRLRRSVEARGTPAALQPVALDAVVSEALHLLDPRLRRDRIEVTHALEHVTVTADPVALEQIVHNLLLNALQALEATPAARRRLEVRTAVGGDGGVLTVADCGPGIPPELLPRLFQPFATAREGGLGLGLSLSETLAAGMGGSLAGGNRDGGGAEFRLVLPLAVAKGKA